MTDTTIVRSAIGVSGLAHWGGYTDSEWDRRLKGRKGPETYREMADGSPTIGALLYAFNALVQQAGHRIEPADESTEAADAAAFVEEALDDLDGAWADTLAEILTALPFGFSLLEVTYKQRSGPTNDATTTSRFTDGKVGWARWSPRAQETILRWDFDDTGTAIAAFQTAPPSYREVRIPLDRCLHFKVRARNQNPAGLSLIRNAYEPWYYYKHISRIEAIGIERDLAGIPVLRVPLDISDAAAAEWDKVGANLRKDEQTYIRLPSDVDPETKMPLYDVSLLTTGGTRQVDTDPILARYERLMLRAVLADFITQGDTGVGSFAQSVSRIDLFLASVGAILESFADVIGLEIRKLIAINGIAPELAPAFTFNDLSRKEMAGFAATLVSLINAGVVDGKDPDLREHVYEELGLPAPESFDPQPETVNQAPQGPQDAMDGTNMAQTPMDGQNAPQRPTTRQNGNLPRQAAEFVEPDVLDEAVALFNRSVQREYHGMLDAEVEAK